MNLFFTFLCIVYQARNKNIIVTKGDNCIFVYEEISCVSQESDKNHKKEDSGKNPRLRQEFQEKKDQTWIQAYKNLVRMLWSFSQISFFAEGYVKRIMADNQEKQESGKIDSKIVH